LTAVLGIGFGHADASAALVVDGRLVAAIAEERLGVRIKHDPSFPAQAIAMVLAQGGLRLRDVRCIAFARNPRTNLRSRVGYALRYPVSASRGAMLHFRRRAADRNAGEAVAAAAGSRLEDFRGSMVGVEHHLCHVASSYYCSPFDGLSTGFSFDGSGDFASAMIARCEGSSIEIVDRAVLPHSLGFFYSAVCQFIGFDGFGEEYKVMGLAPYGEPRFLDAMRKIVSMDSGGWFKLNPRYVKMHGDVASGATDRQGRPVIGSLYRPELSELLGSRRRRDDPLEQRHMDIARSCQVHFERIGMACFRKACEQVHSPRLAYAGGCALNGVLNARLLREGPYEQTFIQSAAADDGTSLGAALWAWHNVLKRPERFHMEHAFWGSGFSDEELRVAASEAGGYCRQVEEHELAPAVAAMLRQGLVMGWFQGRSEWGPRALGNRSILADPTHADMKDRINAKIKRREMFRPFAPAVPDTEAGRLFEQDIQSPFMMHVVPFRTEHRARLPSVVHVDGTGRLQTVSRTSNRRYHDLIRELGRLSGMPVILNTSFNENEPIVETPDQAIDCFRRTGLDGLVLGRSIMLKAEHAHRLGDAMSGLLPSGACDFEVERRVLGGD
jgi:carbamoyltransferase